MDIFAERKHVGSSHATGLANTSLVVFFGQNRKAEHPVHPLIYQHFIIIERVCVVTEQ